ncbi:acetylcholinesterase-like [Thrips palmi]|uniref:Carboxylic ester hydrolase n=1 Tax=Thrips palmi TaxID=161013 RepID=A0A6P8ZAN1_THRPL|nr:acetylcholinesterase-like [Thrips palmi]
MRLSSTATPSTARMPAFLALLWACLLLPTASAARTRTHTRAVGGTADNSLPDDPLLPNKRGFGPEVTVAQGRLLGRTLFSTKGTAFDAFSGIPYAAPPVGELRFKGPRPPSPWPGVRDARKEGRICTQPFFNLTRVLFTRLPKSMALLRGEELPGFVRIQPWLLQALANILTSGEDCLYLNVYTPREAARSSRAAGTAGLPVLLWVYGGGFVWGEGGLAFYDPDAFMDQGMVVVTFNYRLGPLGFMDLGRGSGMSGNAGIKDQAAALQWVRDNIAQFGGDPNKITVYGESAGAVGAHLHLMNPRSASMIRGAIITSGSAVHWWSSVPAATAARRARNLARWTPCRAEADGDARALVQCLRKVPARQLALLQEKGVGEEEWRYLPGRVAFVPSVEEADEEADEWDAPYLTESPRDLMVAGKTANVPIMLGFNSGESLIMFTGLTREPSEETLQMVERNVTGLLPDEVFQRLNLTEAEDLSRQIKRFYLGDGDPVSLAVRPKFFEMVTSIFMYLDTLMLSRYMTASPSAAPVYLYRFTYVGALNMFKNLLRIMSNEACHGDELPYVWRMRVAPASRPLGPSATEYRVRDTFSSMIANFIKTGSPTPAASGLNVTWPPFTAMEQSFLEMGERPVVRQDFRPETVSLWDGIYGRLLGGPIWSKMADIEARRRRRREAGLVDEKRRSRERREKVISGGR